MRRAPRCMLTLLFLSAAPLSAQHPDTAVWIDSLETVLARSAGDERAAGELGVLLARTASYHATQFQQRQRAEQLLERALRGDPLNPRYLAALAIVYEKMMLGDSRDRVLSRALSAIRARPADIPKSEHADIYYRMALAAEARFGDLLHLTLVEDKTGSDKGWDGTDSTNSQTASNLDGEGECTGAYCLNWFRPARFNEALLRERNADLGGDAKRDAYDFADLTLSIDPAHTGAMRVGLRMLAREGDWERFYDAAQRFATTRDPMARAVHALAHYQMRQGEADSLFRHALLTMRPEDRADYTDISHYLTLLEEQSFNAMMRPAQDGFRRAFWRARDPLFLTPENEHEIEHYARVTLARLLYDRPDRGWRATADDGGRTLIRYGAPQRVIQHRLDAGGNVVFWNYGEQHSNFIFLKDPGLTRMRMLGRPPEMAHVRFQESLPPAYKPPYLPIEGLGAQLIRARGEQKDTWEVLVFGRVPPSVVSSYPTTGLFMFSSLPGLPLVGEGRRPPAANGTFDYRIALPHGSYSYSIEALTADRTRASTLRGDVMADAWTPFGVSDMLLATLLRPTAQQPLSFADFEIEPLRCMALPANRRVAAAFEIYGLTADANGEGRYKVTLAITAGPDTRLPARVLRGLGVGGRPQATTTTFDRQRPVSGSRIVEWFEIELPETRQRGATLSVTVRDTESKQQATAARALTADCK